MGPVDSRCVPERKMKKKGRGVGRGRKRGREIDKDIRSIVLEN